MHDDLGEMSYFDEIPASGYLGQAADQQPAAVGSSGAISAKAPAAIVASAKSGGFRAAGWGPKALVAVDENPVVAALKSPLVIGGVVILGVAGIIAWAVTRER